MQFWEGKRINFRRFTSKSPLGWLLIAPKQVKSPRCLRAAAPHRTFSSGRARSRQQADTHPVSRASCRQGSALFWVQITILRAESSLPVSVAGELKRAEPLTKPAGEGSGQCAGAANPTWSLSAGVSSRGSGPRVTVWVPALAPSRCPSPAWGDGVNLLGVGRWVLRPRWAPSRVLRACGGFTGSIPLWSRPLQGTVAWGGSAAESC